MPETKVIIPLQKKYYTGVQIHDVITTCVSDYDTVMAILKKFAEMPSAQPERKKGKWIPQGEMGNDGNQYYNCSVCQCGEIHVPRVKVHYCWNCGARMEEGGE